jgi:hypothetical protein
MSGQGCSSQWDSKEGGTEGGGQQSGCLVAGLIVSCSQLGTFAFPFRCLHIYNLESCYNSDTQLETGCTQLRVSL